jgi:hypothetical protein
MSILRTIGGMLSLVMAFALAWPAVVLFRPALLPLLHRSGAERTDCILSIGSLSISGWQIVGFELLLIFLTLGLVALAVYAFTAKDNEV